MNSHSSDIFDLAERKLSWLDRRQETLSHNIANANTPGFRAKDTEPFSLAMSQAGAKMPLARSSPMHLTPTQAADPSARTVGGLHSPDRNTVNIEQQLTKIADTSMNQELVGNIYKKYTGLFRLALGRG